LIEKERFLRLIPKAALKGYPAGMFNIQLFRKFFFTVLPF